ncbi:MAG: GNAT family N-acetyltransferase [Chloroflexi bacterium]|nr:MAG: GNAT family N-acetyltransferase [Chloroflexota bacterium]
MPASLLDALLAGDRRRIRGLAEYRIPDEFPGDAVGLIRLRREQIAVDPLVAPWLLRAIVRREDLAMVGYVNFHGPPGVNDTMSAGALELGWTVFPAERRRGYATETANALMDWANREHRIKRFVSSTTADNAASLRVHAKLGFVRTGEIVDGEIIFALDR